MCRLVGWVSRTPVTLLDVLGEAAVRRFIHLSTVHSDGWGAAWHDADGELHVTRSADMARQDPRFGELAATTASTAAIVHLRLGTPGFGHGTLNNHPFTDGRLAFAHNGAFTPRDRVLDHLLPPGAGEPQGQTDSERYFLALRSYLGTNPMPAAIAAMQARMAEVGVATSSMNAMLLAPRQLHVISSHDADWQATTIPVWPADEPAELLPPYFPMIAKQDDDIVVAVSSGIVSNQDGWLAIPNHAVLTVDVGTRQTVVAPVPSHVAAT